ncbi:MAG: FkbM family methyltransferase [Desulfobulbaceae bacterium]
MSGIYRYFSQYGEDYLLWNFFDFKPQGFFVDIGAFDGIHLSNSYSFELAGWHGICVEPHPYYFDLCRQNRPNSVCVNKACGAEEKPQVTFNVDNTGLFSSLHHIGDEENIKGHFNLLKAIRIETDTIEVDIVPVNSILESVSSGCNIDFVSIDVEGAELDVFLGFDFAKYTPRVIVVETNTPEAKQEIDAYLLNKGYIFARRTNANSFYVTNSSDREKLNAIDLNCIIEKQIHPLGAEYTIPSYLNGLVFYKGEACSIFAKLDDLAQNRQRLAESREKNTKLDATTKKLDAMLKDLVGVIDSKNRSIKELQSSLQSAAGEIDSLKNEIQLRDTRIGVLDDQLSKTIDRKIKKLFGFNV